MHIFSHISRLITTENLNTNFGSLFFQILWHDPHTLIKTKKIDLTVILDECMW